MDAEELKDFGKRSIRANNFLHSYILKFGETSEWGEDYKKSAAKRVIADCRRVVGELVEEVNEEYFKIPRALEIKESLQAELILLENFALPYLNNSITSITL
jgi:hypothetical protein